MLEKLKTWLVTFPQWGDDPLHVDSTDPEPVSCGLFPLGQEELERQEDILGNVRLRCRQTFLLRRVATRQEEATRWLLAFQQWVQAQSREGKAPVLEDASGSQWLRAEKGKLSSVSQTGTATYEVRLVWEYTVQN